MFFTQKRQEYKQNIQKVIQKWFPDEKIMGLDNSSDALNILRRAGSQKQKEVFYRNKRSFLLAEDLQFIKNEVMKNLFYLLTIIFTVKIFVIKYIKIF